MIWLKDYILERQGNLSFLGAQRAYGDDLLQWPWGPVFWHLCLGGVVTDAEMERFIDQSLRYAVRWPVGARAGQRSDLVIQAFDLPFLETASPLFSNANLNLDLRVVSMKLDGMSVPVPPDATFKAGSSSQILIWEWDEGLAVTQGVGPGVYKLELEVESFIVPATKQKTKTPPPKTMIRKVKWAQDVEIR